MKQTSSNIQTLIGHKRVKHLFNNLQLEVDDECNCGADKMTTKCVLEYCPKHVKQRQLFWSTPVPSVDKPYEDVGQPQVYCCCFYKY